MYTRIDKMQVLDSTDLQTHQLSNFGSPDSEGEDEDKAWVVQGLQKACQTS